MSTLTVLFEDPFWIGVFEKSQSGKLEACRVVFGHEPKDYEIYDFVLKNYYKLKFSRPIEITAKHEGRINPKRMQRKISRILKKKGTSTKSQEAMKLEQEKKKVEKRADLKVRHEEEDKLRFEKRQEKKKQKKAGH